MKRLLSLFAALAALLTGCDTATFYDLKPGQSTRTEVLARMGMPAAEYANADGGATLEYPTGPSGVHCHMVILGPDGILRGIEQALTEANFARIVPGMEREAVRRILGKPGKVTDYPLKKEEVWDWRYEATPNIGDWHFHAHFDPATGRVISTSRRNDTP